MSERIVALPTTTKHNIVDAYKKVGTQAVVARKFGISPTTVGRVLAEYKRYGNQFKDEVTVKGTAQEVQKVQGYTFVTEKIKNAFRALHPKLSLTFELNRVARKLPIRADASGLNGAFSWTNSPQGYEFWAKVFDHSQQASSGTEWSDRISQMVGGEFTPVNPAKPATKDAVKKTPVNPNKFVITPVNVIFTFNDEQFAVDVSSPNFKAICDSLLAGKYDKAVELADVAKAITRYMRGYVVIQDGVITYKGLEIHGGMTGRILDAMASGESKQVDKLVAFFERLMANPSNRAVNELFSFLEANDIEITDDGYFYAWKKVRRDYKDIYTGKMDNSPGKEVRVPRNMVDENSEVTCSHGLHVCSKSYLKSYGGHNNVAVLKCKVDPADVVAIPKDYNNAKMRCCGYYVEADVTKQMGY